LSFAIGSLHYQKKQEKRMKKILKCVIGIMLVSAVAVSFADARESKKGKSQNEEKEISTEEMTKDYEEMMALYKELKTKAEAFKKKYDMLPPDLMMILGGNRGQGDMMGPGGRGGMMGPGQGGGAPKDEDVFK
jgi:hypothetical protein